MRLHFWGKIIIAFFAGVIFTRFVLAIIYPEGYGVKSGWDIILPGIVKSLGGQ